VSSINLSMVKIIVNGNLNATEISVALVLDSVNLLGSLTLNVTSPVTPLS